MLSNMRMEFYPLWMEEHPDLFEKSKVEFLEKAKVEGLSVIDAYWRCGLFYLEASK